MSSQLSHHIPTSLTSSPSPQLPSDFKLFFSSPDNSDDIISHGPLSLFSSFIHVHTHLITVFVYLTQNMSFLSCLEGKLVYFVTVKEKKKKTKGRNFIQ